MPPNGIKDDVILAVKDLSVRFDHLTVLEAISFEMRRGEVLAIMGRSGCGKTTILRCLVGLQIPGAGRIELLGTDVSEFDEDHWAGFRRGVGMLFQFGALINSLNVADNVALPLVESGTQDPALVASLVRMKLALVGLAGIEGLFPAQLSGGMKKRVGLARAMILDPELLFLDEPSSGLDPISAAALDRLISDLPRLLGTSMVVVTHDLQSALRVADRILVVDQGGIIEEGTPDEIMASHIPLVRSLTTRAELGEERVADPRVVEAFG